MLDADLKVLNQNKKISNLMSPAINSRDRKRYRNRNDIFDTIHSNTKIDIQYRTNVLAIEIVFILFERYR